MVILQQISYSKNKQTNKQSKKKKNEKRKETGTAHISPSFCRDEGFHVN